MRAFALILSSSWALLSCTDGGGDAPAEGSSGEPGTTAPPGESSTAAPADGSSEGSGSTGAIEPPPRPSYEEWLKVELPDTLCGNGTPYKFFVNYFEGSEDLMVLFEPGGGCWDYDSCSGKEGVLGAANPDGIPDDHMESDIGHHTPLLLRYLDTNPVRDWNMVFMPYCTGDVHTGNAVSTYADPLGEAPDLEFHHSGHANVQAATGWMREQFPKIPRLFVTGCSAGGAGSLANYYFLRTGLDAERGYLLDDSGPIFPNSTNSRPLHDQIRQSWDIDSILETVPAFSELGEDFGLINDMLADTFPDDRLATTFFRRDFNFSRYSYERFFPGITKDEIHEKWWEDTQQLTAQYDAKDNLAYFIPYWRYANDSHCTIILTWEGTEIQEQGDIDVGGFIELLLDDAQPLQSFLESPQPGEDGTPG
jgi:Pectinacetylesterase